jgi:hypothetical protein
MIRLLDTDTFILLLRGTALVRPRTAREKSVTAAAKRIRGRCQKEAREFRRVADLEVQDWACTSPAS